MFAEYHQFVNKISPFAHTLVRIQKSVTHPPLAAGPNCNTVFCSPWRTP